MEKVVEKLGLGCVTFGREIDKTTAFSLMDEAYAHGIREFDTAAAYGGGTSEEIIGQWLVHNPTKAKQVKLATKILPPYDATNSVASIEQSLRRLGVDQIDLLYFHRWDDELNTSKSWLAIEQLVFDGKVKEIGVSNFNLEQLTEAINLLQITTPLRISAIQNNHNLAVSDLSNELVKCCRANGIKIVSFSPLGAGFLTGKHILGVAEGSRFDLLPAHQSIYFNDQAKERLMKLLEVAKSTGYEPALLALSWAIHHLKTDQVLVGGRSIAQLNLAFKAASFNDEAVFAMLENDEA